MTKRLWAQYHALLGDLEPEELEAFAIWREAMIEEDLYDGWLYVPGWVVEDGKSYEQRCESKKADANGMIGLKSFSCVAESCALTGKLGYYRDSCDWTGSYAGDNPYLCPGGMPR